MAEKAKTAGGEKVDTSRLERELEDLQKTKREELKNISDLTMGRTGPVNHLVFSLFYHLARYQKSRAL